MHNNAYEETLVYQIVKLFEALADPVRLRLIRLLLQGEACVCELMDAVQLPQYAVSRHLQEMRRVGLVEATRRGRWMHYRISHLASADGLHQDLLKLIGRYLREAPEVLSDEVRLKGRLALRESGQCVVGTRRSRTSAAG